MITKKRDVYVLLEGLKDAGLISYDKAKLEDYVESQLAFPEV